MLRTAMEMKATSENQHKMVKMIRDENFNQILPQSHKWFYAVMAGGVAM